MAENAERGSRVDLWRERDAKENLGETLGVFIFSQKTDDSERVYAAIISLAIAANIIAITSERGSSSLKERVCKRNQPSAFRAKETAPPDSSNFGDRGTRQVSSSSASRDVRYPSGYGTRGNHTGE